MRIPALTFVLVVLFSFFFFTVHRETFTEEVQKCHATATNVRFSCYRTIIERHYKGSVPKLAEDFKNTDQLNLSFADSPGTDKKVTYAIFGTNCHTFYHGVGDFVATWADLENLNLSELISIAPANCTDGFIMGLYKRLALRSEYDMNLLSQFWQSCRKGSENQCAHEIGHLLQDKYSYPVIGILDELSRKEYNLTYPKAYRYVRYHDGQSDLNTPFEECKKLIPDNNKVAQCFTGVGHNLFLFSEFSNDGYKAIIDQCNTSAADNRTNCHKFLVYRIGINQATPHFLSDDFEEGNRICQDVINLTNNRELLKDCYIGIGGGIGLFADSEYALTEINEGNLSVMKGRFTHYMELCEKSEGSSAVDNCFAGLFGTRFAKFYDQLKLYHERIEELRPNWDSDFEVVG